MLILNLLFFIFIPRNRSFMKLQTQIPIQKEARNLIDYQSNLFLLGSCFSENIGRKLLDVKLQSLQNPFGILFHPKAIESLITKALNKKEYTEKDVFSLNERWHCFDAHSSLSNANKNELLKSLNAKIVETKKQLINTSHILITLGTSWVYRHIDSDVIVANCHKVPQKKFRKELLPVDEISEILNKIITLIHSKNTDAVVLFTVSPVRHLKDGFIENQQSKSHLIAAIHKTIVAHENCSYFPSYEIMMDELREYRFYNEDMIHPNKTAINYIWERFVNTWFTEQSKEIMKEVLEIQNGINHKAFHPDSEQHLRFLESLDLKIKRLQEKHPFSHFKSNK